MHSLRHIKFTIIALIVTLSSYSQSSVSNKEFIDSPYRSEHNPWFEFKVYKRGYKNEPLKLTLDSLEQKSRKYWSRPDSLIFAQISYKTGNLELAGYYFDNLKVSYQNENEFWWNRVMVQYFNREYNSCIATITSAEPGVLERSKIYFLKKLCQANLSNLGDSKWTKTHKILDWEVDSSLLNIDKDSPEFHEKIIVPLENLSFVLQAAVRHIHAEDKVIARACFEMGLILEGFVSPTQAYIAMSLGRHYDKWDKEILENIKRVKATIIQKKYRIPNFRKYFPRIEYWRFDYQMLKEKIIYQQQDTTSLNKPVLMRQKQNETKSTFPSQLIFLSGLVLLFLALLFFLKTGKK